MLLLLSASRFLAVNGERLSVIDYWLMVNGYLC